MFAETKLSSAGFLTLLQVRTQVAPALIIPGSQLLGREAPLFGDHGSNDAHGTTYDHARNGPTSACSTPLMNPCHPKAVFQIIVGARQSFHVIALKEASRKIVADMKKMLNGLSKRFEVGFLLLHLRKENQVALANLCPSVLLLIG